MRSLLTAATISLAFTLFLTPLFIRLFEKLGWGQVIRTPENAHNPNHQAKRGTPTMGGVIFIIGSIVGYLVGTLTGGAPPSISGILVIWMMVGLGAVGFIDDYMKVRQQRSLGLSGWRKVVGQILVAVPFGIVGGRIYHVITTPDPYWGEGGNPVDAFKIWEGGLGIWGAIALGAFGIWVGCRQVGVRFLPFLDAAVPGVALAQTAGAEKPARSWTKADGSARPSAWG